MLYPVDAPVDYRSLEKRTPEKLDVLRSVLPLSGSEALQELRSHVWLLMLQCPSTEMRFEMPVPNLLVAANSRGFLSGLSSQLDDFFAIEQVALFPKFGDRHVLFQAMR